jgi:PAS domain S-box-containing protein
MNNLNDKSGEDLEKYFFNLLMDNIPDRIYFKNIKGQYIKINKAAALRRGIKNPDETINKTDFDFFTKEHAEKALRDEQEIIKYGKVLENIEEKQTWIGRKEDWASTTKAAIRNDAGEIIGTFGITRDITAQKLAQEALAQSEIKLRELNAIKDKFFSIIAHDLKSPFLGFLGLTQDITQNAGSISPQELAQLGGTMYQAADNLFKFLQNLLEWAQMQSGSISLIQKDISLSELIAKNVEVIKDRSKQKGISINNMVTDNIHAYADEKMTNSVLMNMISNAVKFTHRNGVVTVSAKKTGDQMIEISVRDTGIGMSKSMVEKLFELGEKTGRQGTDGELSTGLGLILCKEFIDKNGGKIWVESQENMGSTFYFTLPPCE